MEYHWQYIELQASFRLSWKKTAVFLRSKLWIAKWNNLENLGMSYKSDWDGVSV